MFAAKEFPILEFDENRTAKIEPSRIIEKIEGPQGCVITFFGEVLDEMRRAGRLKTIARLFNCTINLPVEETIYAGQSVAVVQGFLGAAGAAAQLEELIAMGFRKFVVCGAAGVLQKDVQVGRLIVPDSAVRDEGASYHYAKPSREIECDRHAVETIEKLLRDEQIPYIRAKTWTTDAFYRETADKVALRVAEGCVTVEMEAAAFFAVSRFRAVTLGQILHAGDDLSGVEWNARRWVGRKEIHESLVDLSLKACLRL